MATLLHEYWENDDGGQFGVVSEHGDRVRPMITPNARLIFSLRASSWRQAMQMHNDRLDFGDYRSDGAPNYTYTDEERTEQDAYLQVRSIE